MIRTAFHSVLAAASVAACLAAPALAETPPHPAEVGLMPGWKAADGTHWAALRIHLIPGWHTYWRAPGEAGIPPEVDWTGSKNAEHVRFHWPVPEIFTANGMTTLGYEGEVILPIEVTPADPSAPVTLTGHLTLGVCDQICVPMETDISVALGMGSASDPEIAGALAARPDTASEAGVVSARCSVAPIADGLRVTAKVDLPPVGAAEHAVIEAADRNIWVSEPVTSRTGNMLTAEADLVPPAAQPFDLDTGSLRLTVLAQGRAVDIEGCTEFH
jgi:DsbC/DsbD-like thiol-disulfide interchange protein